MSTDRWRRVMSARRAHEETPTDQAAETAEAPGQVPDDESSVTEEAAQAADGLGLARVTVAAALEPEPIPEPDPEPEPADVAFTFADLRRVMDGPKLRYDLAELRSEREYDRRVEEEDPDLDPLYRLPRDLPRRTKARYLANLPGAYQYFAVVDDSEPITDEELLALLRPHDPGPRLGVVPAPVSVASTNAAPAGRGAFRRDAPHNPWRVPLEHGGTPAPSSASGYSKDDPRNPWRQPLEEHAGDLTP